jgi:hypothetical protein
MGHTDSKMTQRYAAYQPQSLEPVIRGNVYIPFMPSGNLKLLENKGTNKKRPKDHPLGPS